MQTANPAKPTWPGNTPNELYALRAVIRLLAAIAVREALATAIPPEVGSP